MQHFSPGPNRTVRITETDYHSSSLSELAVRRCLPPGSRQGLDPSDGNGTTCCCAEEEPAQIFNVRRAFRPRQRPIMSYEVVMPGPDMLVGAHCASRAHYSGCGSGLQLCGPRGNCPSNRSSCIKISIKKSYLE